MGDYMGGHFIRLRLYLCYDCYHKDGNDIRRDGADCDGAAWQSSLLKNIFFLYFHSINTKFYYFSVIF